MLSFTQFLREERHHAPGVNGDWGFVTKEGKIESGLHHPGIKDHTALAKKLKLGKSDHQAIQKGHARYFAIHPEHDSHQSVQSPDSMQIEMSHKGAPNLHKHMRKLIHQNGVKPRNVIYDIAHHETPSKHPEDVEHDSLLHSEFNDKYGN